MDNNVFVRLMADFIKVVDRPDLKSEFPEQFPKHWDNHGKLSVAQIFIVRFVDQPCELKITLFFDGEEVIQTGILIKFRDQPLVNEVRKGDFLDYQSKKRIDPVAFLKEHYGSAKHVDPAEQLHTDSFLLTVDDDSEEAVFRAVEELSGKSQEELRIIWKKLLGTNQQRMGKDQVSPIIKTWLKKERDRLDMRYLREARLLSPRTQEVTCFLVNEKRADERSYAVITKHLPGPVIRENIDSLEAPWWGGMFFAVINGELRKIPHDQHDRLVSLKSFDHAMEFPVEDIFVNGRHIYSVVFIAEEAVVWRINQDLIPEAEPELPPPQPADAPPGKVGKLMNKLGIKSPPPKPIEQPLKPLEAIELDQVNNFLLVRHENAYIAALTAQSRDLSQLRLTYLKFLYDAYCPRFTHKSDELRKEIHSAVQRALGGDRNAIRHEEIALDAQLADFYSQSHQPR